MIVLFRDRIFCCKPQILLCIQCIGKAASCKTFNRLIDIMHSLYDSRSVKFMYQFFCLTSIFCCINQLYFPCSRNFHFRSFIYITIRMSCDRDRLFPVLNTRLNSLYNNRCTEHCSIKNCTNCSIRTFPHFFQVIFIHTCCIRSDRCTFYG